MIAPNAKNGPKGIFTCRFGRCMTIYIMPITDPTVDPIKIVAQQPITPVKEPMNASRSMSPCPKPSLLVIK